MGVAKYQNDGNPITSGPGFAVTTHPQALSQPYKWKSPKTVFVNSMSDLFHAKVPTGFVRDVFNVMKETPQHTYQILTKRPLRARRMADQLEWPPNVWMGTSVEEPAALARVDELRQIPAAVRFLSCEPLLSGLGKLDLRGIGWVIVGGESGRHARPVNPTWVAAIRDQCQAAEVPFFFKQWGGRTPKANGRELEGRLWSEYPHPKPPKTDGTSWD